jgi:hypothetical protein
LLLNAFPTAFGPQIAEPKRVGSTLQRANGVNGAAIVKEKAASLAILFDAVAVFERIKVLG